MSTNDLIAAARVSKAWPFQEAQRLLKRYPDGAKPDGSPVLFETGYGPSGLPHIGTFQEVLRTTLVRRAFEALIGAKPEDGKTRLVAFSDDMDGLRKVPDNVPNQQLLQDNLHLPLSRVPNPFDSEHASFAAHNNAMLREFLDRFGFQYEFVSASDRYNSGAFDEALRQVLRKNQQIMIGEMSSERIKKEIASAKAPESGDGLTVTVRGRGTIDGVPNEVEVNEAMMAEALADPVNEIVDAIRLALEAMAPELAADIVDRGIVLTGGGALLRNLDVVIREQAKLPVMIADDPLKCVAQGCGYVLENLVRMKNVLSPEV
mgnify:CR=1 FL=1